MEKHWPAIGVLVLALGVLVNSYPPYSPKPGQCPTFFNGYPSRPWCWSDALCPGKDKCCVFDNRPVCVPPAPPSGKCPDPEGFGICVERCTCDEDCLAGQKCCFNGCGKDCMSTQSNCSPITFTIRFDNFCQHDGDLSGEQKCCKTIYGYGRDPL
ncbi:WAP four-disulfide core domain protein 3 [Cololabis saira]|uniref:WAP four-disulfide core domain protein 3 n=1 Tax=Cololabis saira TaxID=129043 RepID=UPI002AD4FC63|nr:WAP four-disulfide core domain protein 3 [Cololabis saira]